MKWFLLLALIVTPACASVQHDPLYDGATATEQDAAHCVQSGPCTVLQIDNSNFYEAVIYLNGGRIGQITGNHKAPIFIRDSQLVDGRCATIVVRLIGPGTVASSTKECVREGWRYTLAIDPSLAGMPLHLWLVPQQ